MRASLSVRGSVVGSWNGFSLDILGAAVVLKCAWEGVDSDVRKIVLASEADPGGNVS